MTFDLELGVKVTQNVAQYHLHHVNYLGQGIYRWNLPVFPGMANKAQVANNGKHNFFAAKYWQI